MSSKLYADLQAVAKGSFMHLLMTKEKKLYPESILRERDISDLSMVAQWGGGTLVNDSLLEGVKGL
jgi:hypothetical protein